MEGSLGGFTGASGEGSRAKPSSVMAWSLGTSLDHNCGQNQEGTMATSCLPVHKGSAITLKRANEWKARHLDRQGGSEPRNATWVSPASRYALLLTV